MVEVNTHKIPRGFLPAAIISAFFNLVDRQIFSGHAGSEGAADAGAVASAAVAECCCGRHRCFDGLLIYIFREGPLRSRSLCKCLSTLTASRVACAGVVFRWMVLPKMSVLKNDYQPLVGAPPVGSSADYVCSSSTSCRLRCSRVGAALGRRKCNVSSPDRIK